MKKKGSRGRQRDCKGLDVDRGWNLEGTSDDAEKSRRPSRGHRRTTFCWLRWWSSWLVMQIGQSRASISNTLKRSYANLGRNPQVVAPLTLVSFFFLLYFYIRFSLFRSSFFSIFIEYFTHHFVTCICSSSKWTGEPWTLVTYRKLKERNIIRRKMTKKRSLQRSEFPFEYRTVERLWIYVATNFQSTLNISVFILADNIFSGSINNRKASE